MQIGIDYSHANGNVKFRIYAHFAQFKKCYKMLHMLGKHKSTEKIYELNFFIGLQSVELFSSPILWTEILKEKFLIVQARFEHAVKILKYDQVIIVSNLPHQSAFNYSNHLNTKHLNTGFISILDFLVSGIQMVLHTC